MYVLGGDELKIRNALPRHERFSLDYFLFLLADDTPSMYRSRAIGVNTLNRIIKNSSTLRHKSIVLALGSELESFRTFETLIATPPLSPAVEKIKIKGRDAFIVNNEWLDWLLNLSADNIREHIFISLRREISRKGSFGKIAFLLRRLSAELVDEMQSRRAVFQFLRSSVIPNSIGNNFINCLQDLLSQPLRRYRVDYQLSPASIRGRLKEKVQSRLSNALLTPLKDLHVYGADADDQDYAVTGASFEVEARNHEEARAVSMEAYQEFLRRMRGELYVNTHSIRGVGVTNEDTCETIWLPRPTPFWRRHTALPELPGFPSETPESTMSGRFEASKRQYSQAVGDWSDDIYSSVSVLWQAIEAWTGNIAYKNPTSFSLLSDEVISSCREIFSKRSNIYYTRCRNVGEKIVTDFFPKTKRARADWYETVISNKGFSSFHPAAPDILYSKDVGVIAGVILEGELSKTRNWMNSRCSVDLKFLYGARCVLAHTGAEPFSPGFLDYLGSFGAELLIRLVNTNQHIK
ncbi:MAG: hypothetical protein AAGA47_04990 [Pseudomonadota bacterium]